MVFWKTRIRSQHPHSSLQLPVNSSPRGPNTHMVVYSHTCRQNTHSDKTNKGGEGGKQTKQNKIARPDHPLPQSLHKFLPQHLRGELCPACLSLHTPSSTMLYSKLNCCRLLSLSPCEDEGHPSLSHYSKAPPPRTG